MPTRGINRLFTPAPDNSEKFARRYAEAVKKNENVELDYSVDTLEFIDKF